MLEFNLAKKGEKVLPPTPAEGSGSTTEGTEKQKPRRPEPERGRKE